MEDLTGNVSSEFEAAAFLEDGSRVAGKMLLHEGILEFRPNTGADSIRLGLDRLEISAGGNQNRLIYFKSPHRAGISVYTTDRTALKSPQLQRPDLIPQIKKIVGHHRRKHTGYWAAAAIVIGVLAGAWLARGLVFELAINSIPADAEIKLGELIEKNMGSTMSIVKDETVDAGIETITEPMVKVADSTFPFKFHVIYNQEVNAFAIPGGSIYIHSALLQKADSAEEVAGVLAHEMAHVIHRHSTQLLVRRIGIYVAIGAIFGDTQGLIAALADQGGFLLSQKFSRDFERQADDTGFKLLVDANIDPHGMLTFFERIKEIQDERMSDTEETAMQVMGSHPATQERIDNIKQKLEELPEGQKFTKIPLDIQKIQRRISLPE
ncbi:MAG: M48 family metallopeptidase [Leptospiraceae bacterium]|nr:M48 family metallopeptidase [Leptospiraceae bacterium]MCB1304888.1 M48 family metallopeptidase [Leptospiraceae bacterium]